jgi:Fe-S-cluster containining protein
MSVTADEAVLAGIQNLNLKPKVKENVCIKCNAVCCRSVAIQWHEPKDKEDWEHIKWLVSHKNIHVYKDNEDDWIIEFFTDCEHLDKKNLCRIYHKRMDICQDLQTDECEKYGKGEYYKMIFRHMEDVDNYLNG